LPTGNAWPIGGAVRQSYTHGNRDTYRYAYADSYSNSHPKTYSYSKGATYSQAETLSVQKGIADS
jgi:hypothetical protein